MAKIICGGRQAACDDHSVIADACQELGVPFSCYNGNCGTCRIKVVLGIENLGPKTAAELIHKLSADERLACQALIKAGVVEIKDEFSQDAF